MPACLPSEFTVQAALVTTAVLWSSEYGLDCTQPFHKAFCDASSNACIRMTQLGLHQEIRCCAVSQHAPIVAKQATPGSKSFDCWSQAKVT